MLDKLKKVNDIEIKSVFDSDFDSYGTVIVLDTEEIIKAAEKFAMPQNVVYMPSTPEFEALPVAETIKNEFFGTLPTQIGYCYGHSTMLNATEWHTSSEVNIAVTDLVIIIAHRWDIKDGKIDSSKFKGFFVPKGTALEVFATTLHYSPCQVSDDGFRWVVALPKNTNTELETSVSDKKLIAKSKWVLAHVENEEEIRKGTYAGIVGINHRIKY
ncbi:MAG: DUF4867 family protein [Clostridia bacterium]|nr:DUF4867 family protein [Clostridia bacterium]